MNCEVSLQIQGRNEAVIINPISMWGDLEVKADKLVTLNYEANFKTCQNRGYTTFDKKAGKIHKFMLKFVLKNLGK